MLRFTRGGGQRTQASSAGAQGYEEFTDLVSAVVCWERTRGDVCSQLSHLERTSQLWSFLGGQRSRSDLLQEKMLLASLSCIDH